MSPAVEETPNVDGTVRNTVNREEGIPQDFHTSSVTPSAMREFCERHYAQILSFMAEKAHNEKLKDVCSRLTYCEDTEQETESASRHRKRNRRGGKQKETQKSPSSIRSRMRIAPEEDTGRADLEKPGRTRVRICPRRIMKNQTYLSLKESMMTSNKTFEETVLTTQYAVSIKEDMAYPCLHFTKFHEDSRVNTPYPEDSIHHDPYARPELDELTDLMNLLAHLRLSDAPDSWSRLIDSSRVFTVRGMKHHIFKSSNSLVPNLIRWNKLLLAKINICSKDIDMFVEISHNRKVTPHCSN
ncbi:hypothetical protein Tco_0222092 [Tanacetum coccineum]